MSRNICDNCFSYFEGHHAAKRCSAECKQESHERRLEAWRTAPAPQTAGEFRSQRKTNNIQRRKTRMTYKVEAVRSFAVGGSVILPDVFVDAVSAVQAARRMQHLLGADEPGTAVEFEVTLVDLESPEAHTARVDAAIRDLQRA